MNSKLIISSILMLLLYCTPTLASKCVFNQVKKDRTDRPDENYKQWALQKICFDDFLSPTKISTEDDKFSYMFYGQIMINEVFLPNGSSQRKLTANDVTDSTKSIVIQINRAMDGTPLALICKTSDEFELVTSL